MVSCLFCPYLQKHVIKVPGCHCPLSFQVSAYIKMADNKHIMISYQWDAKPRMLKLKDRLQSKGYEVWMDVDRIGNVVLHYLYFVYFFSTPLMQNQDNKYRSDLWVYTLKNVYLFILSSIYFSIRTIQSFCGQCGSPNWNPF